MKKIKGLLLFGILILLGIGSSFGVFFELNDSTGFQLVIPNYSYGYNKSIATYTLGDLTYYTTEITYYNNSHLRELYGCISSNNSYKGFNMGYGTGNSFSFGDLTNCSLYSSISNFDYLYLSSSAPNSPYSLKSSGSINSYIFFDDHYIYTIYGSTQDVPDGFTRKKLFLNTAGDYGIVSYNGQGNYLFTSIGQDSFIFDNNGNFTNLDIYSGGILLHYNDYSNSYYTGTNTIFLILGDDVIYYNFYTGFYNGIKEIYDNGILPSDLGILYYNNSGSAGYSQFMTLLNNNHNIVLTKYSLNGILFTSYGYTYYSQTNLGGGYFTTTANYSFTFHQDESVPIFITPGGNNGNQSFPDSIFDGGVFDANTYLIEESIKCYLTSGEVCNPPFTLENSTNYVNNYDHEERVWNSETKTGYLTFNNSVDILNQYCLNVNTIQYSFCSQLYLYEGSPITFYYNNGYFNYIISGSGWQVNLGALWSGQLGYAYCEGSYCSNFNEGLPQFIRKDTGDYSEFGFSGDYISLDFFKHYFDNGFFFQCPFSYSGSYFTIGSKLIDRLDKHDPLKPINCMIAGFSYGVKSKFFGDSKLGLSHSGVFLSNTGPNATRFYTFIDIVLSLGYIFLFSKLFKFLKKH